MLWWAAQNLAVASLLAAGVWAACRLARIGPAARHALWLVVLIKLLTPPMIAWPWAVPGPFGLLPSQGAGDTPRAAAAQPPRETEEPVAAPRAPIELPTQPAHTGKYETSSPRTVIPRSALVSAQVSAPGSRSPRMRLRAVASAMSALWLLGGVVFALVQLTRIARMARLVRSGRAAGLTLSERVARLANRMGLHPIPVRMIDGIDSPLIWSVVRPMLLWPAGAVETMPDASIDGLIVHELAHVRRRDHWAGWLELLAGIAWWWNPLFWYVRHQLRENAELACDAWVVGTLPSGRRAYAEALLAVCEHMSTRRSAAAPAPALGVGTGGRRFLERRLAMILRDRVPLRLPRFGVAMIGLLAVSTLPAWSQKTTTEITASGAGQLTISADGRTANLTASQVTIERAPEPLPPDAQDLIRQFEQDKAEARRVMEERVLHGRAELTRQLKELQDRYTKAGQLDEAVAIRDQIRAMSARPGPAAGMYGGFGGGGPVVGAAPPAATGQPGAMPGMPGIAPATQDDPGNLTAYRDRAGQTFAFRIVGTREGSVWGTNVYTDDSSLAAAAVHTGLLQPGEEGTVRVKILPGRDSYEGTDRNGVTSQPYATWQGSYEFEKPAPRPLGAMGGGMPGMAGAPPGIGAAPAPHSRRYIVRLDPGTLEALRDQEGKTFRFLVTGATDGAIWGGADNIYSDDSNLATAAVHAGILRPGEQGVVSVQILPDRGSYEGSTHNEVESRSWGAWHGSYRILPADANPTGAGGAAEPGEAGDPAPARF